MGMILAMQLKQLGWCTKMWYRKVLRSFMGALEFLLACTRKIDSFVGFLEPFERWIHKLLLNRWIKLFNAFIPLMWCLTFSNWIGSKACRLCNFLSDFIRFGLDQQHFLFYVNELLV